MAGRARARAALGWLVPRAWILGTALAVGLVASLVAVLALTLATGTTRRGASDAAFALGTLVMGFGVLGWSGSVMAGRGFEELQRHLDTNTDWTEADSRRAMTRIGGFGAGVMVGSVLAWALLGIV